MKYLHIHNGSYTGDDESFVQLLLQEAAAKVRHLKDGVCIDCLRQAERVSENDIAVTLQETGLEPDAKRARERLRRAHRNSQGEYLFEKVVAYGWRYIRSST